MLKNINFMTVKTTSRCASVLSKEALNYLRAVGLSKEVIKGLLPEQVSIINNPLWIQMATIVKQYSEPQDCQLDPKDPTRVIFLGDKRSTCIDAFVLSSEGIIHDSFASDGRVYRTKEQFGYFFSDFAGRTYSANLL